MTQNNGIVFDQASAELIKVLENARLGLADSVERAGKRLEECLLSGGTIFTCGNGGSATDAIHLAEELIGKFEKVRKPLRAVCLCVDVGAITCIANDFGYAELFSRQLEGLARKGDVIVGFTTSGNSENVVKAFAVADEIGVDTILVSGNTGGKLKGKSKFEVIVPSTNTARIQEVHTLVLHSWLTMIDSREWK